MRQLAAPDLRDWLAKAPEPVTLLDVREPWEYALCRIDGSLLDVREPWEYALCRIDGSLHVPLGQLPSRLAELDPARTTVVICHHGMRSLHAGAFLKRQGFANVVNLSGGIDGWARTVDPAMAVY